MLVAEGDQVKAGQPLVKLQDTELKAALAQAQADLKALQNGARPEEIAVAQANLDIAQSQLEVAQADLSRLQNGSLSVQIASAQADAARAQADAQGRPGFLRRAGVGAGARHPHRPQRAGPRVGRLRRAKALPVGGDASPPTPPRSSA